MEPSQQNGGADATPQREEKRTDATPQREKNGRRRVRMNRDTPTIQRTETQDKYVSVSTGVLSSSIHIQLFSQNQPPLSSIENQIFIKRMIEE